MRHYAAAVVLCLGVLTGCTSGHLDIDRSTLAPALYPLAERAELGDKQAQFDLGMRYANGDGVPLDCSSARRLLRLAASQSGGTLRVYSPPVTNGGSGRVIPIDRGPVRPGLQTAEDALMKLEETGHCGG